MKNMSAKENLVFGNITAFVEPPPIPLIKNEQVGVKKERNYLKVKVFRSPESTTSKTYEVN